MYVLLLNANGTVKSSVKIASGTNGGPTLASGDYFGRCVASLGDLDGDGVTDLAVGAYGDDTGGYNRGAVHLLLLNANGTVKSSVKIASGTNGGPTLANRDYVRQFRGVAGRPGRRWRDRSGRRGQRRCHGRLLSWGGARAAAECERHGEEQREARQRHERRPHAREL